MKESLEETYRSLNISPAMIADCKLVLTEEPDLSELVVTDIDHLGRPLVLLNAAAKSWSAMSKQAFSDDVPLAPISGFRSYLYQKNLIKKKLDSGMAIESIVKESAIPGFSEHHSGRALDLSTPHDCVLSDSFDKTPQFEWLQAEAANFKFRLSYPKDNSLNIIYEPWHWYFYG